MNVMLMDNVEMINKTEGYPKIAIELLKKKMDDKISMEQFQIEMGYWVLMDIFDSLKFIPYPTEPDEFHEFRMLPIDRRLELESEFYKRDIVRDYLADMKKIDEENKMNYTLLGNLLEWIPANDTANREKVEVKYKEFKERMNGVTP